MTDAFEKNMALVRQADAVLEKLFDTVDLRFYVPLICAVLTDDDESLSPGDRAIVGTKWRGGRATAAVLVAMWRDHGGSAAAVEASARIREIQQAQVSNLAVVDLDAPRGVPVDLWKIMLREGCGITDVEVP